MALTKRFFSIALALLLGLAVFVPAFAADEADPNAPIITKQPTEEFYVKAGKDIILEVSASLPLENNGTLSFAWYNYDWQPGSTTPPVSTAARAVIPTSEEMIPFDDALHARKYSADFTYCAVITNTYIDAEGQTQTASVKSDPVTVDMFRDVGGILKDYWKSMSDSSGFLGALFGLPLILSQMGSAWFVISYMTLIARLLPSYVEGYVNL